MVNAICFYFQPFSAGQGKLSATPVSQQELLAAMSPPAARRRSHGSGEGQEFVCEYQGCGKTFSRTTSLYSHQRNKHGAAKRKRGRKPTYFLPWEVQGGGNAGNNWPGMQNPNNPMPQGMQNRGNMTNMGNMQNPGNLGQMQNFGNMGNMQQMRTMQQQAGDMGSMQQLGNMGSMQQQGNMGNMQQQGNMGNMPHPMGMMQNRGNMGSTGSNQIMGNMQNMRNNQNMGQMRNRGNGPNMGNMRVPLNQQSGQPQMDRQISEHSSSDTTMSSPEYTQTQPNFRQSQSNDDNLNVKVIGPHGVLDVKVKQAIKTEPRDEPSVTTSNAKTQSATTTSKNVGMSAEDMLDFDADDLDPDEGGLVMDPAAWESEDTTEYQPVEGDSGKTGDSTENNKPQDNQ